MSSKTTTWCDACGAVIGPDKLRTCTLHGWILDACSSECVDKLKERARGRTKREEMQ